MWPLGVKNSVIMDFGWNWDACSSCPFIFWTSEHWVRINRAGNLRLISSDSPRVLTIFAFCGISKHRIESWILWVFPLSLAHWYPSLREFFHLPFSVQDVFFSVDGRPEKWFPITLALVVGRNASVFHRMTRRILIQEPSNHVFREKGLNWKPILVFSHSRRSDGLK
jgi:hypothetical protein